MAASLKHYEREKIIWESSLSSTIKIILLAINSFVDAEGKCFPSYDTISRMTSMSRRWVMSVLHKLQADQIIKIETRKRENGALTSNLYWVDFAQIPNLDGDVATPKPDPDAKWAKAKASELSSPPLVNSVHYPSELSSPDLSIELSNRTIHRSPHSFKRENGAEEGVVFQVEIEMEPEPLDSLAPLTPIAEVVAWEIEVIDEDQPCGGARKIVSNSTSAIEVVTKPTLHPRRSRRELYPWQVEEGEIVPEFLDWVGGQLPKSSMHPRLKAQLHLINLTRSTEGLQKAFGYWNFWGGVRSGGGEISAPMQEVGPIYDQMSETQQHQYRECRDRGRAIVKSVKGLNSVGTVLERQWQDDLMRRQDAVVGGSDL